MKIQYWLVIFFLVSFFVSIEAYQYGTTLKEYVVSAVTVGIPNPGHAWSSIECSANSLCIDTANNRVGIGTNNPSTKLDVNGVLNLNANKITNVALPTVSTDAATKEYVDAASSSGVFNSVCYMAYSTGSGVTCATGYTTLAHWVAGTGWITNNALGSSNASGGYTFTFGGGNLQVALEMCHYTYPSGTVCGTSAGAHPLNACKPAVRIGSGMILVSTLVNDYTASQSAAFCCK